MREEKNAASAAMQCVECNSCGSAFDIDTYMAGYTDGKGHCLNCPGINRAATEAAPAAVAVPSEDVRKKIETNTWDHFGDILPTLKAISRGEWYWGANSRCKYIEIRLDTRDGGCILYDRDRVRISPEQFAFQAGGGVGKMDPWPSKNALAVAPTTQAALLEALKEAQAGLEFAAARLPHTTGFVPSHIAALNIVNAALAAASTTQAAPQQEAQEPIGQCCYGGLRPKAACASCSAWCQGIGQAAPVAQGDAEDAARLKEIARAILDYHFALDTRRHGGVAQGKAFAAICQIMGMHWVQGAEAATRAAQKVGA